MLRNCPNAQQFSVSHFNDLRHEFGFKPTSFALTALDIDYERYFDDILEFIDYAEVKEWPPFLCLESLLFRMPHKWKNARFKKWWQDIRSFEAEQFEIAIESPIRLPHTGTFENDLLLQRLAASLVLKKKLLSSKLAYLKYHLRVFESTASNLQLPSISEILKNIKRTLKNLLKLFSCLLLYFVLMMTR